MTFFLLLTMASLKYQICLRMNVKIIGHEHEFKWHDTDSDQTCKMDIHMYFSFLLLFYFIFTSGSTCFL